MTISPGSRLAHYEVSGLLGAGGMGEVWRAKDTKLGRCVAIKVLPEAFTRDAERLARFDAEAVGGGAGVGGADGEAKQKMKKRHGEKRNEK